MKKGTSKHLLMNVGVLGTGEGPMPPITQTGNTTGVKDIRSKLATAEGDERSNLGPTTGGSISMGISVAVDAANRLLTCMHRTAGP
jgi:hypothetical protein